MSKNKHSKLKKGLRKSLRKPLRVKVKTAAVITAPKVVRNVSVAQSDNHLDSTVGRSNMRYILF